MKQYLVACQAHPALVKIGQCWHSIFNFNGPCLAAAQRSGGLMETLPLWHATIYPSVPYPYGFACVSVTYVGCCAEGVQPPPSSSPLWCCLCLVHSSVLQDGTGALQDSPSPTPSSLMTLFVSVHRAPLSKTFVALVALEWFLTRVGSLVIHQNLKI